ncbi:MAG: bifunctional UDP-N-acetylglucosamine diphosphorylase/glucosamine-1-phosphate N-acetyltransferase GlmU [Gammaproteobacteria bacterium]
MTLSIIILAAGKGTRMRSRCPKVLQPLGGRALLSYVFDVAQALNPLDIVCVVGADAAAIQAHFPDATCHYVTQSQPLGTAHAVLQAISHVKGERVLILAGDGPLITANSLSSFIETIPHEDLGVLTYDAGNPTGLGRVVRHADGSISRIVEEKDANETERAIIEVSSGIYIGRRHDWMAWLPNVGNTNKAGEYYLPDVIPMAQTHTTVQAMRLADPFEAFGINDMKQLSQAERFLQMKQADEFMVQGVRFADPARFDLRGKLTAGQDVSIDVNVIIEGNVSLGNNVQIGAGVILKDCTIADNVTIHPFSHLDGAQIESGASIGPFARIRPGTHLGKDVKIGNFVEIKHSTIGEDSKANHLSYVGDAQVGSHVNIGAGVITCNYDGVNKYKTVIDDHAFVGSNASLVAPVTVGEGATIGAGTVLTKDAPAHQLTVARSKQTVHAGWQRPEKIEGDK